MNRERDYRDSAMSCQEFQDHLPLLAGGNLNAADRERALSHLAECPDCRRELAEHLKIADLVRSRISHLPEPSCASWKTLKDRMDSQPPEKMQWTEGLVSLLLIGGVPRALADLCGSALKFWEGPRAHGIASELQGTL